MRLLRFCHERFVPLASLTSAALMATGVDGLAARSRAEAFVVDGLSVALTFAVFGLLYVIRVQDEVKDLASDRVLHPERPLPRGLVSVPEVVASGFVVAALVLVVLGFFSLPLALSFAGVFAYVGLMSREFFAPKLMEKSKLLFLLSHQAVVPLFVLAIANARGAVSLGVALSLALLVTGATWAFEFGRKAEQWREVFAWRAGLLGALGPIAVSGALWSLGFPTLALLGALVVAPFLLMSTGLLMKRTLNIAGAMTSVWALGGVLWMM